MNTCKECIHWGLDHAKAADTGEWYNGQRICEVIDSGDDPKDKLSTDSSAGGYAYCYVGADFGCVKWKPKPCPEPTNTAH